MLNKKYNLVRLEEGKRMVDLNTKTDRVYYVLQMNLKCDTDEATKWMKIR